MPDDLSRAEIAPARNVKHLGAVDDLPGGGQVMVRDNLAYIGHMSPPYDTTIVDVSDPGNPKVVAEIPMDLPHSHSHKTRVAGDLMITNVELDGRHYLRRGARIPEMRETLLKELARPPTDAEIAAKLTLKVEDFDMLEEYRKNGYDEGGFRVWDISNPMNPKLITHKKTHGFGVHRFDMDENYAYITTEMEGFLGAILVVYDLSDPVKLEEVCRWWMPGQHLAGGETQSWEGYGVRLHHAMRVEDQLWASCWEAGFRIIDFSDPSNPRTISEFDHHPAFKHPTHTILPAANLIDGKRIGVMIDEEHTHRTGQPHAGMWTFDMTDITNPLPLAVFEVSERNSPYFMVETKPPPGQPPMRFGAHQYQEHIDDTRVYAAWFSGGLRVVDIKDPSNPEEIGHYVPAPRGKFPAPQSNDVDTDSRGLIYLLDRLQGLDILEMEV